MCMLSFIFTNYKNNRGQGGFIANVCALAMYVSAYAKMAAARSDWLHPLAVARIGGLHSSNLYITSLGTAYHHFKPGLYLTSNGISLWGVVRDRKYREKRWPMPLSWYVLLCLYVTLCKRLDPQENNRW